MCSFVFQELYYLFCNRQVSQNDSSRVPSIADAASGYYGIGSAKLTGWGDGYGNSQGAQADNHYSVSGYKVGSSYDAHCETGDSTTGYSSGIGDENEYYSQTYPQYDTVQVRT